MEAIEKELKKEKLETTIAECDLPSCFIQTNDRSLLSYCRNNQCRIKNNCGFKKPMQLTRL